MVKNKKKNRKKQIKNIKVEFSAGRLTNYSGIRPIYKFMEKLKILKLLEKYISLKVWHNIKESTSKIIGTAVIAVMCGLNRIRKVESFSMTHWFSI